MRIETIIFNIVSSQDFQKSAKQKELLQEAKSLINLFKSHIPSWNSIEIFLSLKANLFYQKFNDRPFFKAFINKIEDSTTIKNILALNINYSEAEKKALNNSLSLSILYHDLKEEEKLYEGSQDKDENIFEIYFEDFKTLKTILSSEKVSPKDIEWFLDSDLFDFMSESEDFEITIKNIYRLLLANTEIKGNSEFNKHRAILAEKSSLIVREPKDDTETPAENINSKNKALEQISELISVLNAQKKQLRPSLGKGIFYTPKTPVFPANKRKLEEEPDINNPSRKQLKC